MFAGFDNESWRGDISIPFVLDETEDLWEDDGELEYWTDSVKNDSREAVFNKILKLINFSLISLPKKSGLLKFILLIISEGSLEPIFFTNSAFSK